MFRIWMLCLTLGLALSACGASPRLTPSPTLPPGGPATAGPVATTAPQATRAGAATTARTQAAPTQPAATAPATSGPQPTSGAAMTAYRDEVGGWAIDYPTGWNITDLPPDAKQTGTAYSVTFQSFKPGVAGEQPIPAGQAKFDVTVIRGNVTTVEQALEERRRQFTQDGTNVVSAEPITLQGGLPAMRLVLEATRGPVAGAGQRLAL